MIKKNNFTDNSCCLVDLFIYKCQYRYLSIVKKEGLQISQPAIDSHKSEIHHRITARDKNSTVHRRIVRLGGAGRRCTENSTEPPCTGYKLTQIFHYMYIDRYIHIVILLCIYVCIVQVGRDDGSSILKGILALYLVHDSEWFNTCLGVGFPAWLLCTGLWISATYINNPFIYIYIYRFLGFQYCKVEYYVG